QKLAHVPDATDVLVAIGFAEPEFLGEPRPDGVAVQELDRPTGQAQSLIEETRRSRFACSRHSREPHGKTLARCRRRRSHHARRIPGLDAGQRRMSTWPNLAPERL